MRSIAQILYAGNLEIEFLYRTIDWPSICRFTICQLIHRCKSFSARKKKVEHRTKPQLHIEYNRQFLWIQFRYHPFNVAVSISCVFIHYNFLLACLDISLSICHMPSAVDHINRCAWLSQPIVEHQLLTTDSRWTFFVINCLVIFICPNVIVHRNTIHIH